MIDKDILDALESYKRSKRLVNIERQRVLAILPEEVANEFHYNGRHAVEVYPNYSVVFEELLK